MLISSIKLAYSIFIISIFIFNPVNIRIVMDGSPVRQLKITFPRDKGSSGKLQAHDDIKLVSFKEVS